MKQGKKWMLVVLALLAVVTVTLPLVGCKNDTVAEPVRYTVKFSKGANTEFTGTVPEDITVESGTKLTDDQLKGLADTAKFSFDGWYDGETKVEAGYTVTKNVTLTAQWTQKQVASVTFSPEENVIKLSTTTEGATIKYKVNEETEWTNYVDTTVITLTAETKKITAYATKEGWKDSEPVTKQYYTVTFKANNGTSSTESTTKSQIFTAGEKLAANTFEQEGFVFIGWSEDSEATSATYGDKAKFTATKDTTLYAVWNPHWLTFTSDSDTHLKVTYEGSIGVPTDMAYSTDGKTWTDFKKPQDQIPFGNGTELYLRGNSSTGTAQDTINYINFTFKDGTEVYASGDIRTLVDWDDPVNAVTSNARFCSLFENCHELVTAPKLPAETLAGYCYYSMFSSCESLETAPELKALNLADYCYNYMFSGCTELASVTMLATNVGATSALNHWLDYTAENGTLTVANNDMVNDTTITGSLPSDKNWNVVAKTN